MKRLGYLLMAAFLGAAVSTAAAEEEQGRPARPGRPAKAVFERMDQDGDGAISLAEFTAAAGKRAERAMTHLDADENGVVTGDEFKDAHVDRPRRERRGERGGERRGVRDRERLGDGKPARPFSPPQFSEVDENGDGQITLDELTAHHVARATERFARLDKDGDESLTREELRPRRRGGRGEGPRRGPPLRDEDRDGPPPPEDEV